MRRSPRDRLAMNGVRVVNRLSRGLGRGDGTVAGGRVGLAISPSLLRHLSRGRQIVVVSGTNGKTTTSALMRAALGAPVGGNETGANMPPGHVAALVASNAVNVVLEVDEAWLGEVVAQTSPVAIVLLNLSRDQLDRASEVRQLALRWQTALAHVSSVVANANDPLIVFAAAKARKVSWVRVPTPWRRDAMSCPECTRPIHYEESGNWWCECGLARPDSFVSELTDTLEVQGNHFAMSLALPGEFNRVNAAMVATTVALLGLDVEQALDHMSHVRTVQGRFGRHQWRGRNVSLVLAKNPAGTGALLSSVSEGDDELWIAINDQIADGRDPSWLYDVDVRAVARRTVWCFGERRLDLATRLTYDGFTCEVVDDPDAVVTASGDVTLIANYTAFQEWRRRLATP